MQTGDECQVSDVDECWVADAPERPRGTTWALCRHHYDLVRSIWLRIARPLLPASSTGP